MEGGGVTGPGLGCESQSLGGLSAGRGWAAGRAAQTLVRSDPGQAPPSLRPAAASFRTRGLLLGLLDPQVEPRREGTGEAGCGRLVSARPRSPPCGFLRATMRT